MKKKFKSISDIIYSTNPDFKFEDEKEEKIISGLVSQHDLKIWLNRLGGGKFVTRITGFYGDGKIIDDLAKTLKQKFGVGGTVKDREILLQGDLREKVFLLLVEMKYKVKKAGG
ncbi:MAG: translation initiation factor [Bacteroidia bacterium]